MKKKLLLVGLCIIFVLGLCSCGSSDSGKAEEPEMVSDIQVVADAEALANSGSDVYMYYWEWAPDKDSVLEAEGDVAEVSPWGRPMHCMEQILVFGCVDEGYPELAGPSFQETMLTSLLQPVWYLASVPTLAITL